MSEHWRLVVQYMSTLCFVVLFFVSSGISEWRILSSYVIFKLTQRSGFRMFCIQKLRHGSLIHLRNGVKQKVLAISFYLDILSVDMLLQNMHSR